MIDPPTASNVPPLPHLIGKKAPPKAKSNDPTITKSNARLTLLACIGYMLAASAMYFVVSVGGGYVLSAQVSVIVRCGSVLLFFGSGIVLINSMVKQRKENAR